jgi:hypothetical protein
VASSVIFDNRSLTVAAQNRCFRAARVSKRYAGHHTRITLAALQDGFEESGRWLVRCITSFLQVREHAAERTIHNFVLTHHHASPADKQKLEAIWHEAGLGPFPENANDDKPR